MNAASALACARAAGTVALAADELEAVEQCCARIGRRVVALAGREMAVSYPSGYGPNLDDEAIQTYELPQTRLVALALCLALCDDAAHPFPGQAANVELFDATAAQLVRERQQTNTTDADSSLRHLKAALADLAEMGYVRLWDGNVALGPALASWSESDWASFRETREQLLSEAE